MTQIFLNSYLFQNFKIQNSKNKNKGYFCRLRLSVALLAGGGVKIVKSHLENQSTTNVYGRIVVSTLLILVMAQLMEIT